MAVSRGAGSECYEILGVSVRAAGECLAREKKLGRVGAIEVLPEVFATEPELMARFEREAEALPSAERPAIASITGGCPPGITLFLAHR